MLQGSDGPGVPVAPRKPFIHQTNEDLAYIIEVLAEISGTLASAGFSNPQPAITGDKDSGGGSPRTSVEEAISSIRVMVQDIRSSVNQLA